MFAGQVNVELTDGTVKSVRSVLFVHVYDVSASLVSEEDAVVLDVVGILFEDLACGNNFTLNLTDFVLALHVVPEFGTSNNWVTCKDTHSEKLWVWVLFGNWQSSANDVKLSHLKIVSIKIGNVLSFVSLQLLLL